MSPQEDAEAWLHALRWVMTRPGIVSGLPGGPAPMMAADDPRLESLIAYTRAEWPTFASTLKSHKLGLAFEALMLWGMEHGLTWTILGRDVQVFHDKRTIGALDCVVRDDAGEVTHWELAYKLYLQCDEGVGWESWLGPAGKDRLSLTLGHMLNHQLPLSTRPEAHDALGKLAIPAIHHRRIVMQGTLFSPWGAPRAIPRGGVMAAEGCWLREHQVRGYVTQHPTSLWIPRTKPLWFGPASSRGAALDSEMLLARLPLTESLLFSRVEDERDELTFIVPDGWGQALSR